MACNNCRNNAADVMGADPANIQWQVVRGDTAKLRIGFYENDEVTFKDTSTWTYAATAYDPASNTSYTLSVEAFNGYVDIVATPTQTESWGQIFASIVAELTFDLECTIPPTEVGQDPIVWTPIIGTIAVIGDVTRTGGL